MAQALYSCGLSVDQQSIILLTGVIKLSCSVKITDKKKYRLRIKIIKIS